MPSTKHIERHQAATLTECSLREFTQTCLPCVSPEQGRHVQCGKKSRRHCISSTATHIEPFLCLTGETRDTLHLQSVIAVTCFSGASCYVSSRLRRRVLYNRTQCNSRPSTESTQKQTGVSFSFKTTPTCACFPVIITAHRDNSNAGGTSSTCPSVSSKRH